MLSRSEASLVREAEMFRFLVVSSGVGSETLITGSEMYWLLCP
jgi:hypothetical protein